MTIIGHGLCPISNSNPELLEVLSEEWQELSIYAIVTVEDCGIIVTSKQAPLVLREEQPQRSYLPIAV